MFSLFKCLKGMLKSLLDSALPCMQAFNFPADVSFSFGGPGNPRYLVNQLHYDNPDGVTGRSNFVIL